ncbi:hypothetical protein N7450_006267 [Penicillium hetheringtonii]|uniref:RelA/SpoT domain-containing protein n=1 Tax=Penicillium hetheringtonii TaxID=911720 RepID=A0AAD6DK25_9EURO|nr:hypothetical protein N7450_006267 [Penicillium hetheringtonii]
MSPSLNIDHPIGRNSAVQSYFDQFLARVPFYESLLETVEKKCRSILGENDISHFIENRVKNSQSLRKKLDERQTSFSDYYSVKNIEEDIVDLCGLRIVFHSMEDQQKLKSLLENIFDVKMEAFKDYIGDLSDASRDIATSTLIEVQVRSLVDDMYARYMHPIYKSGASSTKVLSNARCLRMSLENARTVAIAMQESAETSERKKDRQFETADDVGKCFRKLLRSQYDRDFIDSTGVTSEALKSFLESLGKNTPRSLQALMEGAGFKNRSDCQYNRVRKLYAFMEFNFVLYLMDQVLLDQNEQANTSLENQDISAKEKMEIILSTLLWMNKLLRTPDVWRMELANTKPERSLKGGLEWLKKPHQRSILTKGREATSEGQVILDELWGLFKDHEYRPIQLSFAMSRRGMVRNVVAEMLEVKGIIDDVLVMLSLLP